MHQTKPRNIQCRLVMKITSVQKQIYIHADMTKGMLGIHKEANNKMMKRYLARWNTATELLVSIFYLWNIS